MSWKPSLSPCDRHQKSAPGPTSLLPFLFWPSLLLFGDLLSLLAGFREADCNRLLLAFHLPALAAFSFFQRPLFLAAYGTFDVLARAFGIFSRHWGSPVCNPQRTSAPGVPTNIPGPVRTTRLPE